ncbi:MAG: hypothetical protein WC707_04200 [Candidatus Babeliaceae bacterium]|jgi:peptidoglycan hydrolase CwlO-like protein
MTKNISILSIVGVQLLLIFFYIHHNSRLIKLSYEKQKNTATYQNLLKEKSELQRQLEELNNLKNVKEYATNTLHMVPQRLAAITPLYRDQIT